MGVSHETWNKDDTEQRADFSTGLKVEKEKGLHQKPLKDFPMHVLSASHRCVAGNLLVG